MRSLILLLLILAAEVHATCPELDIEIGQQVPEQRVAELETWLCDIATSLKSVYGRFPIPELRVKITPIGFRGWGDDRAVAFPDEPGGLPVFLQQEDQYGESIVLQFPGDR